jgi:tetratricopeptide (TPR) repeat protein
MNNLGIAYRSTGRTGDAVRLFEEVRDRAPAAFGANHLHTLATLNNLGLAYRTERRLDDAARVLGDALPRCQAALPADHPLTLAVMNNVADVYRAAGRTSESAVLFREVVRRAESLLGPDHPDVFTAMFNLGEACRDLGRADEAVDWHEQALAGRRKKLARGHTDVYRSMNALADAYTDAGRGTDAGRLVLERLALLRADARSTEPVLATFLTIAGQQLIRARQFPDAERVLRDALGLREKLGPGNWATFYTRSLFGAALLGQDRFAEAEQPIVSGYKGLKGQEGTIPPGNRHLPAAAGKRVVELYERWGRPDEAVRWRDELGLTELIPPPRTVPAGR